MSWLRSAVYKAVEVGGNSNLSHVVRSYADTVVNQAGQAVVGGAKLFQDRLGARNFQNYKVAVKRIEEVSVSCRGEERVQLLRRWLIGLKEIERLNGAVTGEDHHQLTESTDSPTKGCVSMYYDPDLNGEPMNFRDMFLRSQALEGITLSLILEEPSEEELILLLQIFRVCLLGEKEAQDVTVRHVRDLAKAFSTYKEEVLAKREEILEYAQDAIAGLKMNAEIVRIDSEVSTIHTKLDHMKVQLPFSNGGEKSSEKSSDLSSESLKEAFAHFELCSRLEELLLQKKHIMNGDTPTAHRNKLDKLKALSESLASSSLKAEKSISNNRLQKEESLKFLVSKTSEMVQLEKELSSEIKSLHSKKDELEEELKKVTTALTSANGRLHNIREERYQFDEASNQIVQHFKLKDDELAKSMASYKVESEVCSTFVNFLESTWGFQSSYADQTEKLVDDELEKHEEYFVDWTISFLSANKEEVASSICSVRDIAEILTGLDGITTEGKDDEVNPRKNLEEQYHIQTSKLITAFSLADDIGKHFSTHQENSRNNYTKLFELLYSVEKLKIKFGSIKKPRLEHVPIAIEDSTFRKPRLPFLSSSQNGNSEPVLKNEAERGISLGLSRIKIVQNRSRRHLDAETQWSKIKMELELDEDVSRRSSTEGNFDWEFDSVH